MEPLPGTESVLFVQQDMDEPRLLPFAGGTVAAFAHRCPGKLGPNEDAAAVISIGPGRGILAVADGVGGHRAGHVASARAVSAVRAAAERVSHHTDDLRPVILDAIERANQGLIRDGLGAATTLAVVEFNGRRIRPYHVGDSMILLVGQRGKVKCQPVPHSPVGYAVEAGVMDEHEAMYHEQRHLVSNIVGDPNMRIEIGAAREMAPRDTLVIASDGLSDNLRVDEIIEFIRCRSLATRVPALVDAARGRMRKPPPRPGESLTTPSKPDDLSVLVFRQNPPQRVRRSPPERIRRVG